MRNARQFLLAMLVLVGGVTMACTDAGAPTNPSEWSPSFSTAEQELTKEEREERHEQLKLQLELQRERIKQQKELRKGAYELARDDWKEHKHEWKAYKELLKRAKKGQVASTLLDADLLRCKPRPFEGDAAIIGPDGGRLQIGEHELVIPEGALSESLVIWADAPTSSLVDVEFYPEGLQFAKPAKLTLSYKDCQVPFAVNLRLAYVGWGLRILELPPSEDIKELSEVTGDIDHFSRYAVAY
ncbi:MAG TPA: hypothetical protein VFH26_00950 [Gemmatimonadales bacterium]|nr:hypothetical protein [Gemmatimonadales bacterium]